MIVDTTWRRCDLTLQTTKRYTKKQLAIEPGGRDCADSKKNQKTLYVLPSVLSQSDKMLHFLLRIGRRATIRYKKTLPKQPRLLPL